MKLGDILKNIGSGIIREAVPGGGILLDVINSALPSDKKLPTTATGAQTIDALSELPPDQQLQVLGRDFDIQEAEIRESHSTARAMLEHDANNPQSTRPRIALGCFYLLAAVTVFAMLVWGWGVVADKPEIVKAVVDGWPFVLALTGTFSTVLLRYFGAIGREQKQRLNAANGVADKGVLDSLVSGLFRRKL